MLITCILPTSFKIICTAYVRSPYFRVAVLILGYLFLVYRKAPIYLILDLLRCDAVTAWA